MENLQESIDKKTKVERRMSNPKNFCEEALKLDIRYEYLLEAKESIGCTNLARMFNGKSSRGGKTADMISRWINTFEYVRDHPDEEDHEQKTTRSFDPMQAYYDYVNLIKTPIDEDIIKSWNDAPKAVLSRDAEKYGYTLGIANSKALETLKERLISMAERRKNNIWNKRYNNDETKENELPQYKFMNVGDLRALCKERNLHNAHIQKKEGLVTLLERNPLNTTYDIDESKINYDIMNLRELKGLCKERGSLEYNNLRKEDIIEWLISYDKDDKIDESDICAKDEEILEELEIKEYKLKLEDGSDFLIPIRKDGMVNATLLCKAGNKEFYSYKKNKDNQAYIEAIKSDPSFGGSQLIITNKGNSTLFKQGTWVHRLIAIDVARWVFPPFALQIAKWTDELLRTGSVVLQRPIRLIRSLTENDIEAEELEIQFDWSLYTNSCVLYIAYIGDGLVKVGFSDSRYNERERKHTSCETSYKQYRPIAIFEISGKKVDEEIKSILRKFRVKFSTQTEIYKPPKTISEFVSSIENLLKDNDTKFQLRIAQKEIIEWKLKYKELELDFLKLMNETNITKVVEDIEEDETDLQNDIGENHKCLKCDKSYSLKSSLRRHIKKYHGEDDIVIEDSYEEHSELSCNNKVVIDENSKNCSKCKKIKKNTEFNKDTTKKDGLRTTCRECEKTTKKIYKQKKADSIKNVIEKKCSTCDITKPISNFTKHLSNKDGFVNNCKDCSQAILNKKRLDKKNNNIRYNCECGKSYSRIDVLNKHKKTCLGSGIKI